MNAGRAGRRVEQVVGRAAAVVEPAARLIPLVATPPDVERERVQDRVAERARHAHWPRPGAADPQVAGAVDDEAGVGRQLVGDQVGEQPLREPAAVERDAGRAAHDAGLAVGDDRAPARVAATARRAGAAARAAARARAGGPARGAPAGTHHGAADRRSPRGTRHARPWPAATSCRSSTAVAGRLDLARERAVDEAAGARARGGDRLGEGEHRRARRHRVARVGVQPRELAVRREAGEPVVPLEQPLARPRGGRAAVGAGHAHLAGPAEAREALDRLARS